MAERMEECLSPSLREHLDGLLDTQRCPDVDS